MSEFDKNGNFKDIVAELRSVAMIETGLLYSRRLMLNQASEEIERLRAQVTSENDNSARYCRELAELQSKLAEARAEAETARGFEMTWKNHRDELLEKNAATEAKLAEAVKVIDLMADVVVYDATMQGPKVMGVNGSAARRAAEAARSFLQSLSPPGSGGGNGK